LTAKGRHFADYFDISRFFLLVFGHFEAAGGRFALPMRPSHPQ
jgi:hypothetical protein